MSELYNEYENLLKEINLLDNTTNTITNDDILIVVDMQNDFLPVENAPTGGRFGVPVFIF